MFSAVGRATFRQKVWFCYSPFPIRQENKNIGLKERLTEGAEDLMPQTREQEPARKEEDLCLTLLEPKTIVVSNWQDRSYQAS